MIAALMELTNRLIRLRGTDVVDEPQWDEAIRLLLLMLAPIAPHISEELWSRRLAAAGEEWSSIQPSQWPRYDETLIVEDADRAAHPGQRQAARRRVRAGGPVRDRDRADRHVARQGRAPWSKARKSCASSRFPNRLVNVVSRPRN